MNIGVPTARDSIAWGVEPQVHTTRKRALKEPYSLQF
jgi:hypothetical protein